MKKILIMRIRFLYLFVGTIIIIALFIIWLFKRPCEQWERRAKVPVSAFWNGGCVYCFRIFHQIPDELYPEK